MTHMQDLMAEAARLGVSVRIAYLDPPLRAHYDHDSRQIVIGFSLTMAEKKEALGHELGHAHYGHDCTTPETERLAFRRAAALLVDAAAYRAAERIDSDPQAIADELGLTRRIVRVFQKELLPDLALRRGA